MKPLIQIVISVVLIGDPSHTKFHKTKSQTRGHLSGISPLKRYIYIHQTCFKVNIRDGNWEAYYILFELHFALSSRFNSI